jgi:repressor LexA
MTFGDKLKEARKAKGYTQRELSDLVDATNTAVSNWENNINKPDMDTIEKLCGALSVSPKYFFTVEMDSIFNTPGILPVPRTTKKPLIGNIACGDPILAVENLDGYVDTPEDIHCDFALKCKGDSMIGARIHDGDVVYIRQQDDVENSEIAAVIIDEEDVTLKRVYKLDHGMILQAENPAYAPIQINGSHSARIIGKAVGFTSIIK